MRFANTFLGLPICCLLTLLSGQSALAQEGSAQAPAAQPPDAGSSPSEGDATKSSDTAPTPDSKPSDSDSDVTNSVPRQSPAPVAAPNAAPTVAGPAPSIAGAQPNASGASATSNAAAAKAPTTAGQAQAVAAQESDTSMSVGAVDVVVTGKRSRTLELPGSVDVIGEDQTSKEVTTNALDLMRRIPGFAYQDYGNGGVPNGFMLRGFSSNHGNDTLVVIDGVPINDHSWNGQDDGAPDLNQLTSEEIERIAVIKGPLDARYGNWGRSGIVEITTRQAGDFWRGNLQLGSYNTKKEYVSFGSEHFDGRFNQVYSVESFTTDGWRQNSAQQRQNAYAKWFYRPAKNVRLGVFTHLYRADWSTGSYIGETEWQQNARQAFPGSFNDGGYKSLNEIALHADAKFLGRFPVKAILWSRESKASRFADWTYEGNGQTEDHGFVRNVGGLLSMDTDWDLTKNQTLHVDGGVDYRNFNTHGRIWNTQARVRQSLSSDDRYIFQNGGIYLKASYDIAKRVRLSGGIREDVFWGSTTNEMDGSHSNMKTYSVPTYKAGVVGDVLKNVSLYGNVGTTYRLPNQAAKYLHPAPQVAGLLFWETGVKATALDMFTVRYAYFQSTERLTRLEQGQYLDDGKGRRAGHEVELKVDPIKNLEVFTALTVHDGHYVGGANDGNLIPTVPRYIWKVGVQGETPWGTGGRVQYNDVGKWKTDTENTHSYGGYRVVDAGFYQVIAKDWSLALDVKNLFDAKYAEFVSYWANADGTSSNQYMPSNPRTVFATLRFSKD